MIPKVVTFLVVFVMIGLSFSPLNLGCFYILFRPLIEPYSIEHHTLFANIPLSGSLAVLLVLYSIFICIVRKGYTILAPNIVLIYLLILFSSFSFLHTLDYRVSIAHVFKILTAVALYNLMYGAIKTTKDARKVIFAIVLASILPMLIGYYQFLTGTGYKTFMGMTNRPTGGLGWPNMYGIFLAISFCAGLMLLLQQNTPFRRIFLTSVIASMAVSSIIALNRGTWVALSAALLFALPLYRQEIRVRWFILAGILIAIIFSGVIVERFMQLEEITPMGQTRNTLATRIENWRANLSLVPRHPLIGFGIGTAQLVAEKFHKTSLVPHNDYLRLLVEMGILGPLLYILFLLRELHRNVRQSFDKRNWFINYPTLVAVIYWIIISFTQNVVHSVISFPMFLSLVAVSRRWNELTHSFGHPLA